jgi:hypothetical protein
MNNLEVDIYINQIKGFFEKNPESLKELIGDLNKEKFYDNVKKIAIKNYEENEDVTLSKEQMLNIVVEMYNELKKESQTKSNVEKVFENFHFGKICLN